MEDIHTKVCITLWYTQPLVVYSLSVHSRWHLPKHSLFGMALNRCMTRTLNYKLWQQVFPRILISSNFFFMTPCHPVMYPKNLKQQRIPATYLNKEHQNFSQVLNHLDKLLWKRFNLQFRAFYVHVNFKIVYKYLL